MYFHGYMAQSKNSKSTEIHKHLNWLVSQVQKKTPKKPVSLLREEIRVKIGCWSDFVLCTSGELGGDSGQSDGTGRKKDYERKCPE